MELSSAQTGTVATVYLASPLPALLIKIYNRFTRSIQVDRT